jgi:stage V sporulation protein G
VEITEVRIKLMEDAGERLHAFCSITFDDCFVIRDLKIIEGTNGPFVAMPSRKLTSHCTSCGYKNHLRAMYCNQCGARQKEDRAMKDEDGRAKLYADIAHPINSRCRELIQERVIQAFHEELRQSQLPGYVSSYDDFDDDFSRPAARPSARDGNHTAHAPRPAAARRIDHGAERPAPSRPATEHPRVDHSKVDYSKVEQAKVEPAATEPRAPHKAHSPAGLPGQNGGAGPHTLPAQTQDANRADRGGFGAGIF